MPEIGKRHHCERRAHSIGHLCNLATDTACKREHVAKAIGARAGRFSVQKQHVRTNEGPIRRGAVIFGCLVVGRFRDGDGAGFGADQVLNIALKRVGAVVGLQPTESQGIQILLDLLPGLPRKHDLFDLLSAGLQCDLGAD